MKKIAPHLPAIAVILVFFMMALASVTPKRYTYTKPVTYPCIHYPPITYSPILLKINIDANYTPKDLPGAREVWPGLILDALHNYNYSYKLADGVAPNLVLYVTFTTDGYAHYGITLRVDWQGQSTFTITLPSNYITSAQLTTDLAKELNRWVTNGWHSGDCK
jgi:hypothetical protein